MEHYFRNKYLIAFYDERDEYLVNIFDNIWQISKYIEKKYKIEIPESKIYFAIYNAIRNEGTTSILGNRKLYVHLIDIKDLEGD